MTRAGVSTIFHISYYTVELLQKDQEVSGLLLARTETSNDTVKREMGTLDELSALKSSKNVFL